VCFATALVVHSKGFADVTGHCTRSDLVGAQDRVVLVAAAAAVIGIVAGMIVRIPHRLLKQESRPL
jgi:hypothetical protein